jgi:multidrug efflux pump subunit AcrB
VGVQVKWEPFDWGRKGREVAGKGYAIEQARQSIELFMSSLYEAVALVVLVSLIGFWEWRSALLMALSIPMTLAMTFDMMYALGINLQQISIGSMIIALGLLVDDPVVAGMRSNDRWPQDTHD